MRTAFEPKGGEEEENLTSAFFFSGGLKKRFLEPELQILLEDISTPF